MGKFIRQTYVLLKKNLLLHARNRTSTVAQIGIGMMLCLALVIMQAVIDMNQQYNEAFVEAKHPQLEDATRMVPCISHVGECYTFVYAPNDTVSTEIARSTATIGGIPNTEQEFGIRGFGTTKEMNDFIVQNPNTTGMAVTFKNPTEWNQTTSNRVVNLFDYELQLNETRICRELGVFKCNNPYVELRAPLQTALDSAFIRKYGQGNVNEAKISVHISDFPHPDLPISFYVMDEYGQNFFYMIMVFNFVVQSMLVVMEKEKKLKASMRQMGMLESSYWLSWHLCFTIMNTLMVLLLSIFGAIVQLDFFIQNNFFLYFTFLWISAQSFTSFAMLLASFFKTTKNLQNFALSFFILSNLACSIIDVLIYAQADDDNKDTRRILAMIPSMPFFVGMRILIQASVGSTSTGMGWSEFNSNSIPPADGELDQWSLQTSFDWLFSTWILYAVLAWYVDNVTPNVYGRRESVFFPLIRLFRMCFPSSITDENTCAKNARNRFSQDKHMDIEVRKEADLTLSYDRSNKKQQGDRDLAVRVLGLVKRFGSFRAVNNVSYGVDEGQCFVLLGHNGAGKTTSVHMLTGNSNITDGDVYIFGKSVKQEMDALRAVLGVCPQHDILWDQLTGQEHLELFARLKGVPENQVKTEVQARLKDVLLESAANLESRGYSGGMLRRLSLAIALLGDPKIVLLDECTTGMDPVTRRDVWDMIQRAKRNRVIILTTHSMEEADVLGDRIGVMSHGRMQAIGTPLALKNRFGGGYRLSLMLSDKHKNNETISNEVATFIRDQLGGDENSVQIVQKVENHMLLRVEDNHTLPSSSSSSKKQEEKEEKEEEEEEKKKSDDSDNNTLFHNKMIRLFKSLEAEKGKLGVFDFSIGLPTLEEVFLELSKLEEQQDKETKLTVKDQNKKDAKLIEKLKNRTGKVTVCGQASALFRKNTAYQCTQKGQLCCIIFFPVFILALLLLLDKLLFEKYRIEAMCGEGISKGDCKTKGIDLDCVADLFSKTYVQNPTLEVGMIDEFYRGRVGINPNCNADTCFEGLELPRWDEIKVGIPASATNMLGSVSYNPNTDLQNWYQDFVDQGTRAQNCDYVYEAHFECKSKSGADQEYCYELKSARDWYNANNQYSRDTGDLTSTDTSDELYGVTACMPSSDTGQVEVPSNETLAALAIIEQERVVCYNAWFRSASDAFEETSLANWIMNTTNNRVVVGGNESLLGGFYTSDIYEDSIMRQMAYQVAINAAGSIVQGQSLQDLQQVVSQYNVDFESLFSAPSMNYLCFTGCNVTNSDGNVDRNSNCAFWPFITAFMQQRVESTENMCLSLQHIDAVRGVHFETYYTKDEVDLGIYNAWYGKEITPEFRYQSEEAWRQRRYLSDWTASSFMSMDTSDATYEYVAYYNNSATKNKPGIRNWIYILWNMDNSIVQKHTGRALRVLKRSFPRTFTCNRDEWLDNPRTTLDCDLLVGPLRFSILDFIIINFLPLILLLLQFVIVSAIVYDKANRLRLITKMMGLSNVVYWATNYMFYFAQYSIMVIVVFVFGSQANVQAFVIHDTSIVLLLLFLWGHLLIVSSFLMTVFFAQPRTATVAALLILILAPTIGDSIFYQLFNSDDTPQSAFAPFMLFPPWVMLRFVYWICLAGAFRQPITTDNWTEIGEGALLHCVNWMIGWWFFCVIALWYCEQVVVVGYGTAKEPLFFIRKQYWEELWRSWRGRRNDEDEDNSKSTLSLENAVKIAKKNNTSIENESKSIPIDVTKESDRAFDTSTDDTVRILGLRKVFAPPSSGVPPKVAVRSFSMGVKKFECIGLLGHNGAGKTTLINMLTGLFPPTDGTALYTSTHEKRTFSIKNSLSNIHSMMGVCPQHDILWESLNATDHLNFYGRLKGFSGSHLSAMVRAALRSVNLDSPRDRYKQVGSFSGGMKRRLSCAISLMGLPEVVFMDEPSTGLDPASRHSLWNVISSAKGDKSIFLTTHSMEEADVLCDRIAIMAAGEIQCVGNAATLKRRFGRGYTLVITAKDGSKETQSQVDDFVHSMFKTAKLLQEPIAGTSKYEVSRDEVVLSQVFSEMNSDANQKRVGFIDWGFTETTLEEVFLKLALLAHTETKMKIGRTLSGMAQDYKFMSNLAKEKTRNNSLRNASSVNVDVSKSPKSAIVPLEIS